MIEIARKEVWGTKLHLTMEVRDNNEGKQISMKSWHISKNQLKRLSLPYLTGKMQYQLQKTGEIFLKFDDGMEIIYRLGGKSEGTGN